MDKDHIDEALGLINALKVIIKLNEELFEKKHQTFLQQTRNYLNKIENEIRLSCGNDA